MIFEWDNLEVWIEKLTADVRVKDTELDRMKLENSSLVSHNNTLTQEYKKL